MKTKLFSIGIILILLIIVPGSAFVVREGENIVIDTPVYDDLLVSGGTVTINAPVQSLTFAGGTLTVNAPVKQNLIAAGGQILVNAPVGTDLIVAGGQVNILGDVGGKVLAAGGQVTVNGNASNVAISGGSVNLGSLSHITGDALVSASDCSTKGIVEGRLDAKEDKRDASSSFNPGTVVSLLFTVMVIIQILFAIGMLILGIILIYLIPSQIKAVVATVREKTLISLIYGVAEIVLAFILGVILLITIIGIPLAVVIGFCTIIGLILSTICTGAALGTVVVDKLKKDYSLIVTFVIGFVILQILFLIPVLGFIIEFFAVFIGLGALILTGWKMIESPVCSGQ